MNESPTMKCDWCGKEFPADARACVESGYDTFYTPDEGEEWKGGTDAPPTLDLEEVSPHMREKMKAAMGLDDSQLDQLLTTGKVDGLGAIICIECQDGAESAE